MQTSANVPHDGAISRSGGSSFPPARIGAKSQDSLPTAVSADGDCVDLVATRQGQLRVYVDYMPAITATTTASSTTTALTAHTLDVTDVSTTVFSANSSAKGWMLTNNGSQACYVTFGATAASGHNAAANGGHYLGANGGTMSMAGYNGAISAICESGEVTVLAASRW